KELQARNIRHFSLAVWSSADMQRMGLPEFEVLHPYQPATGWLAISARSFRFGDVLHESYPPDAFGWIAKFQPVAYVGSTIRLFYPRNPSPSPPRLQSSSSLHRASNSPAFPSAQMFFPAAWYRVLSSCP